LFHSWSWDWFWFRTVCQLVLSLLDICAPCASLDRRRWVSPLTRFAFVQPSQSARNRQQQRKRLPSRSAILHPTARVPSGSDCCSPFPLSRLASSSTATAAATAGPTVNSPSAAVWFGVGRYLSAPLWRVSSSKPIGIVPTFCHHVRACGSAGAIVAQRHQLANGTATIGAQRSDTHRRTRAQCLRRRCTRACLTLLAHPLVALWRCNAQLSTHLRRSARCCAACWHRDPSLFPLLWPRSPPFCPVWPLRPRICSRCDDEQTRSDPSWRRNTATYTWIEGNGERKASGYERHVRRRDWHTASCSSFVHSSTLLSVHALLVAPPSRNEHGYVLRPNFRQLSESDGTVDGRNARPH
jgi:hypothetical protein